LIVKGDWTHRGGQLAAQRLLTLPELPTAVFACNDTMAIGALAHLHCQGVQIPARMSVVGFDNIIASAFSYPPLTTMATPIQEIGHRLCQMLLERVAGDEPQQTRHVTIRSELLVRQSTSAPTANGGADWDTEQN
jgi:DNA-binding LacI/PurR family transcriptional regulator